MIPCVTSFVCLLCVALVNAKSNRIVGGDKATPGQFKYQVSVQVNRDHHCGGAIISDQHVLTSAHCVVQYNGELYNYQVVAGTTNLLRNEGVRIDVEKIYVPRKFSPHDQNYDIAVLKLRKGLGLGSNPNLQKVDLPSRKERSHVGETLVMSGYGFVYVEVWNNPITGTVEEVNGRKTGLLKYASAKVISNPDCTRMYTSGIISSNLFCAQTVQRGRDPEGVCTGDSGGPLVSGNTIIGIFVQSPLGCNEQFRAAIYIRVSPFVGLIEKAMKDAKSSLLAVHEIHNCGSSSHSK